MHTKRQETQSEETKQSLGPYPDMTQVIKLSDREFKIIVVNVLKALIETWVREKVFLSVLSLILRQALWVCVLGE